MKTPKTLNVVNEATAMNTNNENAQAFPVTLGTHNDFEPGLSKLEEFTKVAMQGMLSNPSVDLTEMTPGNIAHDALAYARATLRALEEETKKP